MQDKTKKHRENGKNKKREGTAEPLNNKKPPEATRQRHIRRPGGRRGIRTPERKTLTDLQSAPFSHLDILPKEKPA